MSVRINSQWPLVILLFFFSCNQEEACDPVFRMVDSAQSGISFSNDLTMNENMNLLTYMYFYNGGGVSVADFNDDDLIDIYFTSNQEENRLYLNKGNFQFEDVTSIAGVQGLESAWTTGTTTADVNGDGLIDIYVSMLGNYRGLFASNLLYVNQGNDENGVPIFRERASQYGLDLVGFSTQAAFFDYDLDGDLDMFQLNHSVHSNGTYKAKRLFEGEVHKYAGDKLMRNDNGRFVDVSLDAGIYSHAGGYGLGLGVSDINNDGYPDIYVGNDFHEDDYLYINNGDGTFDEKLQEYMRLTSRYSMGNDLADINNDGLIDVLSMDMLPRDYKILVKSQTEDPFDIFTMKQSLGYGYQYSRNTLQLNNGDGTFSEIGMYSGLHATDWSWSALIADFDFDQTQDVFVSNGISKRPNDLDYIKFMSDNASKNARLKYGSNTDLSLLEKMPELKIPNFAFSGSDDLKFRNVSKEWGLQQPSYSSGSAYADFDNDGDIDLVVNNTFDHAFLYENTTVLGDQIKNDFLKVELQGPQDNQQAVGAKICAAMESGEVQVREVFLTRGFQSSVSNQVFFGVRKGDAIASLTVAWPSAGVQRIVDFEINTTVQVNYDESRLLTVPKVPASGKAFQNMDSLLDFSHKENTSFNEFSRERLIPHSQSSEGPAIAVGDVNGDGWDDIYMGGAKHQAAALFVQTANGFSRSEQPAFEEDIVQEDVDAIFLDYDGDGDLDLVVLTGGNEFFRGEAETQPKLYRNDDGMFFKVSYAFNGISLTGGAMAWTDFDEDGRLDVFFGGRAVTWSYGARANSFFLQQNEEGTFTINTEITKELVEFGLTKDAKWADMNDDGYPDLITVGEWGAIQVLINEGGKSLRNQTEEFGLSKSGGMWNSLEVTDLNDDGRPDIVAGNLGTNTKLNADEDHPMKMYVGDFDENGKTENLIYTFVDSEYKLFANKDDITNQLIVLKKKYNSYNDYSEAEQDEIVPSRWLQKSVESKVYELRSCVFLNANNGFKKVPLPIEAQFSPVNAIHLADVNDDNKIDLITGGNYRDVHTQIGKYDASYANVFLNNGDGTFETFKNGESGLQVKGEVRHIREINLDGAKYLLFARNNMPVAIRKRTLK